MPGNPFEERPVDQRPVTVPAELLSALDCGVRVIQVRGACGMGKTTLLHGLRAHLASVGTAGEYLNLARLRGPFELPASGWLVLDEAQRATARALADCAGALAARGDGLLLGSHVDRRPALRASGLEVVDHRLVHIAADDEARELLARYGELDLTAAGVARLRRCSQGNRELLLRLAYELAEDRPAGPLGAAEVERAVARLRRDAPELLRWRRRHWQERLGRPTIEFSGPR